MESNASVISFTSLELRIKVFYFLLQILLFPEGTDLTKETKERSDKFAEKSDLPKYDFVLHPRTTGFTHIMQEMKNGR